MHREAADLQGSLPTPGARRTKGGQTGHKEQARLRLDVKRDCAGPNWAWGKLGRDGRTSSSSVSTRSSTSSLTTSCAQRSAAQHTSFSALQLSFLRAA